MSFFCHHIFAIKWDILKFVSLQFKLWSVILSVWSSIRLCCSYFTVRTPWPAYRGAKASLVMMRRGSFRSVLDVKYIQEYLQKGRARKMIHPHDMLTVVMAVLYLMRCEPSAALHCSRVTLLYCCSCSTSPTPPPPPPPPTPPPSPPPPGDDRAIFELAWRKWK